MEGPVIELHLARGCCCGDSYAQADDSLLFTLSNSSCFSGYEHVLRDAHSVPLLHSRRTGSVFNRRVEVYKGSANNGGSLVCTIKKASFLSSKTFHIYLAGSSLKGPPNYRLKESTFAYSVKIIQQDHVVAKAKQGCSFCGYFGPDYTITTFSGMDQAMVVLLVAIYDDLRPKNVGAGGGVGGG